MASVVIYASEGVTVPENAIRARLDKKIPEFKHVIVVAHDQAAFKKAIDKGVDAIVIDTNLPTSAFKAAREIALSARHTLRAPAVLFGNAAGLCKRVCHQVVQALETADAPRNDRQRQKRVDAHLS